MNDPAARAHDSERTHPGNAREERTKDAGNKKKAIAKKKETDEGSLFPSGKLTSNPEKPPFIYFPLCSPSQLVKEKKFRRTERTEREKKERSLAINNAREEKRGHTVGLCVRPREGKWKNLSPSEVGGKQKCVTPKKTDQRRLRESVGGDSSTPTSVQASPGLVSLGNTRRENPG